MAQDLAADYQDDLQDLDMEKRLDLVAQLLSGEGFTVEWERQGDVYQIRESNCPYFHVGQNHPEVCSVESNIDLYSLKPFPLKKSSLYVAWRYELYIHCPNIGNPGETRSMTSSQDPTSPLKVIWQAESTHLTSSNHFARECVKWSIQKSVLILSSLVWS